MNKATMVKVTATKEQLSSVGIDKEITNKKGRVIQEFKDGYIEISIPNIDYHFLLLENYDIPKEWLDFDIANQGSCDL